MFDCVLVFVPKRQIKLLVTSPRKGRGTLSLSRGVLDHKIKYIQLSQLLYIINQIKKAGFVLSNV
jgi:hypothetical protein